MLQNKNRGAILVLTRCGMDFCHMIRGFDPVDAPEAMENNLKKLLTNIRSCDILNELLLRTQQQSTLTNKQ